MVLTVLTMAAFITFNITYLSLRYFKIPKKNRKYSDLLFAIFLVAFFFEPFISSIVFVAGSAYAMGTSNRSG